MDEKISKVQSPDRQMGHSGLAFAGHRTKKQARLPWGRERKPCENVTTCIRSYRNNLSWLGHLEILTNKFTCLLTLSLLIIVIIAIKPIPCFYNKGKRHACQCVGTR